MDLTRVLQSTATVLSHTFRVGEDPTDSSTTPTVTVKRLDGTAVTSGNATHGATGVYTFTLPAQANLDTFTVDWAGTVAGLATTARDFVEVCGGFLFELSDARSAPPPLSADTYPTAMLADKRTVVERECETICRQGFVPRFMRAALSGQGTAFLPTPAWFRPLRKVRAVIIAGVAMSPADVAAIGLAAGMLVRPGGAIWPAGFGNILVEWEYGLDFPPPDLADVNILRLRSLLTPTNTKVPFNALSFTAQDGGTYRLSTPNRDRTGVPQVDAVYERYGRQRGAVFA